MPYVPKMGWTYFILLHLVVVPLAIYLGTFIRMGKSDKTVIK